jgi:hypothetical protein
VLRTSPESAWVYGAKTIIVGGPTMAYYLLLIGPMAIYRLVKPITAFDISEKRAFTIPSGSFIEKEDLVDAIALTHVRWSDRTVWVPIPDLVERSEPPG